MEQGIFYVVVGLASICFFLLGKYVFPQAAGAINNALTMLESYPLLMKWGEAACRYIKQYFDSMTGEEKNKRPLISSWSLQSRLVSKLPKSRHAVLPRRLMMR